ncbi:MAG: hypothetical protein LBC99_05375 [Spirochaetota bacterium]|jgi:hypothetical protein|nr:hypothetical protein [Spirochaetota bacterium]
MELHDGMTDIVNSHPTLRDINIAIDSLDAENTNSRFTLKAFKGQADETSLRLVSYINDEATVYYSIFVKLSRANNFREYHCATTDKAEIKKYFEDFFLYEILPDINKWRESTSDRLNEEKTSGWFHLVKLAKSHHREDKKILDCYGLAHGAMIQNIRIMQPVAESIILLKDILNLGNCGDVYFSKDKNWIDLEIIIPEAWRGKIKYVRSFSGYKTHGDFLSISCYDHEDKFIQANIKPLENLDRLLPLFILFLTKKMIHNDTSMYNIFDYFYRPCFEKFKRIYIDFAESLENDTYYVVDENCKGFDPTQYTPLSELYQVFLKNMQESNEEKTRH